MANNYFSTWTIKSTENSDKVSHNTHSQPKSLRDTAYEWKRCYYLLAITSKTPFNFQVIEMEHFEVAWSFSADEQVMHILHIGHEWHQFRWINARWPRFPSFSSLITFTAPDLRSGSSPALWPKVFLYGSENFVGKEVKSMGSDKSKATIVLIGSNVSVHSQGNRFDLHGDKSCLLRSIHGTVRLKFTLWCKSVESRDCSQVAYILFSQGQLNGFLFLAFYDCFSFLFPFLICTYRYSLFLLSCLLLCLHLLLLFIKCWIRRSSLNRMRFSRE